MNKKTYLAASLIIGLIVLGVAGLTYRLFFLKLVRVPTGAMMNTIIPGDQLIVNRLWSAPNRGQIILFKYSNDPQMYIARVIGLPGESVQLRNSTVYINGSQLEEERIIVNRKSFDSTEHLEEVAREGKGSYQVFYGERGLESIENQSLDIEKSFGIVEPYRIPDGSYFVLGDNRDNSYDSRYRGAVSGDCVWGSTSIIYLSSPIHSQDLRWDRIMKRIK